VECAVVGVTTEIFRPEEPVTVAGDGARLHQVLTNLLANARIHAPAGTTVRCGLARKPVRAVSRR
jgi:two-component system OmpR family sensor kinase